MRIGFLVWNQFQVAHCAEIAKNFSDPDFIFIDRNPAALKEFDASWLAPYGAYARFLPETSLELLDGEYDAIITQFRVPLEEPWRKTKLLMLQYSLAKPKTAYNSRWFSADHGLIYGDYSESIVNQMCAVSKIGNPRFDPLFEGRLDRRVVNKVESALDPAKKTILYQPTWGDLSTSEIFFAAIDDLANEYNVIYRPHHMTSIRMEGHQLPDNVVDVNELPKILDIGLYLNLISDVVISDVSGAIFDALYCGKKVLLLGGRDTEFSDHKKADATAIEVGRRDLIGPYVQEPSALLSAIEDLTENDELYKIENERLVKQCFVQRGGCSALAAEAIRGVVNNRKHAIPYLQRYAGSDFNSLAGSKAHASAVKRARARLGKREAPRLVRGRSFVKNKTFFQAGRRLERWTNEPLEKMGASVYQAFNASLTVRFSRVTWKAALARMLSGDQAPSTSQGKDLLPKIGLFKSALSLHDDGDSPITEQLRASADILGPLIDFFDLAAKNELAPESGQKFISVNGDIEPLTKDEANGVVELYLSLSLTRELADEGLRPYRSSQLLYAQNLFQELLKLGLGIYPRIQGGVTGVTPASPRPSMVKLTWHTIDHGLEKNIHLKLGSLYGHFVMDSLGYSGWASPAEMWLGQAISSVDLNEADTHWRILYSSLVEGNKSKYSQEDTDHSGLSSYVFFPMQVVDDAVAKLADLDTLRLLEVLMEWSEASDAMVVVKRHPMCRSVAVRERLDSANRESSRVVVSDANIHQLIAGSRCVVTVNSGVGAEALVHLKPVITTGGSDYAPATMRARTVDQLIGALDDPESWRISDDDIKKFLFFYTKRYMVSYDDIDSLTRRLKNLLSLFGVESQRISGDQRTTPSETSVSFEMVAPLTSIEQKRNAKYVNALETLFSAMSSKRLVFWIDSAELPGDEYVLDAVGAARVVPLGVLASDLPDPSASIRQCVDGLGLEFRPKVIGDTLFGATLSAGPLGGGPKVEIRFYYEIQGHARSLDTTSLLANDAVEARAMYMASVRSFPASTLEKVRFLLSNPAHGAAIALNRMGLDEPLLRLTKRERPETIVRLVNYAFTLRREMSIPRSCINVINAVDSGGREGGAPESLIDYIRSKYSSTPKDQGEKPALSNERVVRPLGRRKFRKALSEVQQSIRFGLSS